MLDVASVKMKPAAIFERHLAGRVPWAATHPLFGPASLARRERPLRVVVCPNDRHPAAVEAAANLYRRLGCQVRLQDAEAHDREMAAHPRAGVPDCQGLHRPWHRRRIGIGAAVVPWHFRHHRVRSRGRRSSVHGDSQRQSVRGRGEAPVPRHADPPRRATGARAGCRSGGDRPRVSHSRLRPAFAGPGGGPGPHRRRRSAPGRPAACSGTTCPSARGTSSAGPAGRSAIPSREDALLAERAGWARAGGLDVEGTLRVFRAVLDQSRALQTTPEIDTP